MGEGVAPPPRPRPWAQANAVRRRCSPLLATLVLLVLGQQVLSTGPLTRVDRAVEDALVPHRDNAAVHLAQHLTWLGNPELVVPVLLVIAALVAVRLRSPRTFAVVVGVLVATAVCVLALKELVARPAAHGAVKHGGAWPSGHTTTATVVWGTAVRLLHLQGSARSVAQVGVPVLVAVCLVVGGYHQVTDVLAGWALGAVLLAALDRLLPRPR